MSILNTVLVRAIAATKNATSFVNEHGVDMAKDAVSRAKEFASDISAQADMHNEAKALAKRSKATAKFYSKYGADIAHARAGSPHYQILSSHQADYQAEQSQFSDECNNMIDPNAHDQS